jgi:hypothetical protein
LRPDNDTNDANNAAPPPGLSAAAAIRGGRPPGWWGKKGRAAPRDADSRLGSVFRRQHNIIISSWDELHIQIKYFSCSAEFSNVQNEIAIIYNK